ncbi:Mpm1p KNAG_0B05300 [Huiozyma naganishii CBS 8797]|uniref:Uncharacterized protein n=1 Tax=Huiozyma naganishii (strain ATCC MYA-139 / BCRC 22969 / CBS 8797 / KCTC 17520 / NBRC 10181 / NCYC 3082 / Yp74L-3) TaxID=1071383 RepID=J7RHG3_HUIN7|nr:hypothetical protein KNAG_0B05300 [Kazachstania naganishii CBS 8797]CCK68963.1 hypothetical protein KNAG_0B05300 [Kazachstania naganishii CBS 8797]
MEDIDLTSKDDEFDPDLQELWSFNYTGGLHPTGLWPGALLNGELFPRMSPLVGNPFDLFPPGAIPNVTGVYSWPVPTERQFAQCNDVKGVSLWDKNGWWRCLFPQSVVSGRLHGRPVPKGTLTKEMWDRNGGKLDGFFNDYTTYMLWRVEQRKKLSGAAVGPTKGPYQGGGDQ